MITALSRELGGRLRGGHVGLERRARRQLVVVGAMR